MTNSVKLEISKQDAAKLVLRIKELTTYAENIPAVEAESLVVLEKYSSSDYMPSSDEINMIVNYLSSWIVVLNGAAIN